MRVLYLSNIPRDAGKGASGCDIGAMAALRERGHDVDELWDYSAPRRLRHANLHQLLEAPFECARRVRERRTVTRYDAVISNQPLSYAAAREHRRAHREGVFVVRSHGWEPHVREIEERWYPGGD